MVVASLNGLEWPLPYLRVALLFSQQQAEVNCCISIRGVAIQGLLELLLSLTTQTQ